MVERVKSTDLPKPFRTRLKDVSNLIQCDIQLLKAELVPKISETSWWNVNEEFERRYGTAPRMAHSGISASSDTITKNPTSAVSANTRAGCRLVSPEAPRTN